MTVEQRKRLEEYLREVGTSPANVESILTRKRIIACAVCGWNQISKAKRPRCSRCRRRMYWSQQASKL